MSVYGDKCLAMPRKYENGVDTYDHTNYRAPVQAVIGMAGYSLDKFPDHIVDGWSLSRISKRGHATKEDMTLELSDEEFVTVTVSGVLLPAENDWIAMISPTNSNVTSCPSTIGMYIQTGDTNDLPLPLLCHYPVKAQYMSNDPDYVSCKKKECKKYNNGKCEMRLRWVSGDNEPQQVQYGDGKSETSQVSTFSKDDMCNSTIVSPAVDFGWHDPGYIHTAVMTGLDPSSISYYRYGSDSVGWSDKIQFKTPPGGGSDELKFLAFGDMGKAPLDASAERFVQPGSLSVTKAMADEVNNGNVDSIFHIGDISYATGFLVEWDFFLHLITPVASQVSYMTAIGNHERDYIGTGSVYITPDSGGECGVAYEAYFPMPTPAKDKPWYSIEQGPVHFTVISTEHDWSEDSEQYEWMKKDMASIDRSKTPWLIFTGHRPMHTSSKSSVDRKFVKAVEPLLLDNKVDLVLFGHVHNYERTCLVYGDKCLAMPRKDENGVDTYDHTNYSAPVQAVIGMAGYRLDKFPDHIVDSWSLSRISKFGYLRGHATKEDMTLEFVNADTRDDEDSFRITKKQNR
ncbi:hypothetical protein Q3G72_011887 [Acer saccharum]|nr:hypothetical protein Q3G72_011887 [Acer saccharum]